ncbi:hypothetical protein BSKO_07998 [Bryopsis sp. KO-2023]|nr:hypothetical protein BSKO_07998 [Bryopsis sp. KO-2023]
MDSAEAQSSSEDGMVGDVIPRGLEDLSPVPMGWWMLHTMRKNKNWRFKRLHQIIIPGAHNAATAVIKDDSFTSKIAGFAAQTQGVHPYELMMDFGVRFLDLRVTDEDTSGELWTSHNFLAQPLEPILDDIRRFLNETEKELLVVQIKKDFDRRLSENGIETIKKKILERFKDNLITDASGTLISLSVAGKRLLIVSDLAVLRKSPIFADRLTTSWGTTRSGERPKLIRNLNSYLEAGENLRRIRTLDAYITPNAKTFARSFLRFRGWRSVISDANRSIRRWTMGLSNDLIERINIVSLDRVPMDFSKEIIAMNMRL